MQTTTLLPPNKTETKSDSDCDIGIAVFGIPDGMTWCALHILGRSLQQELRRAGIAWQSWGELCLPGHALIVVTVAMRDPSLALLRNHLGSIGVLPFSQVAYFDRAELFWRSVHPSGAQHFEKFFSDETFQAARENLKKLDPIYNLAKAFKEEILRRAQQGGDQPTNPT